MNSTVWSPAIFITSSRDLGTPMLVMGTLPPAETMDTMVFVYPDKTIVMNQHIRAALRKAPEVFPLFRRSGK